MDGKELKYCLGLHAKKYGIQFLCRQERDFLKGRIDYNTYLNECYEEYSKDKTACIPQKNPARE